MCRRLRRRVLGPLCGVHPLDWRNATRGVRLFVRASFSGLEPRRLPDGADDHLMSALFVFGAIGLAGDLTRLSPMARRRIELGFLRRAYGLGRLRARRLRRELHVRARMARGRIAAHEGRTALVEWFDGQDPSHRLRLQIERMPEARLGVARRAPVRPRGPRQRTAAVR